MNIHANTSHSFGVFVHGVQNLCQEAIALGEDETVSEATLEALYKRALPYYEKARELAPDDKTLWLNGLYTCYYRLNMTEKAAEIEKLM